MTAGIFRVPTRVSLTGRAGLSVLPRYGSNPRSPRFLCALVRGGGIAPPILRHSSRCATFTPPFPDMTAVYWTTCKPHLPYLMVREEGFEPSRLPAQDFLTTLAFASQRNAVVVWTSSSPCRLSLFRRGVYSLYTRLSPSSGFPTNRFPELAPST